MICALTIRKLKPGTFEDFRQAFMAPVSGGEIPEGFKHFDMVRSTEDPNEVICFGFFEGTADQLRAADSGPRQAQLDAIAPYVESVGPDALYDVIENISF